MYDFNTSGSFAFGPFEETKVSVYMMALGIIESGFVNSMLDDPTKLEFLCQYLLSDPNLNQKMKDIN